MLKVLLLACKNVAFFFMFAYFGVKEEQQFISPKAKSCIEARVALRAC